MKSRKTSRFFWYLLALAAVLLAYFYFVLPPLTGAVAELDRKHEEDLQLMKTYDSCLADLERIKSGNDDLAKRISAAQEPPPTPDGIAGDVNGILKAEGVRADKLTVSGGAPAAGAEKSSSGGILSSVGIRLELTCTPRQLQGLLSRFDGKRGYYVGSLDWSAGSDGTVSASVGLSLYYYSTAEESSP